MHSISVTIKVESFDESGDLVAFNQFTIFMVGAGGFGGKRDSPNMKASCMYLMLLGT